MTPQTSQLSTGKGAGQATLRRFSARAGMKTLLDSDGVTLTNSEDGLLTLRLDRGQNVINPPMVSALEHAISCVEAAEHPKSLVILGGTKFFSNGLDVTWMMNNSSETPDMIQTFWRVLARLLVLDCRTVAAISGHAYGAGIFLALACDWRVMRTERGFVNFPELNLGMRLSKPFAELSKAKLSPSTLREGVLAGRRYDSVAAVAAGLVDANFPVEALPAEAEKLARAGLPTQMKLLRFDPEAFSTMKVELYTDAWRALTTGLHTTAPDSKL